MIVAEELEDGREKSDFNRGTATETDVKAWAEWTVRV
jgi:hypothetical protein